VPLSLETAQTLALGPFNPHIITPEWLVKNKVCEDAEVEIRFIPLSQGLAFSFKEVQWQIDSRLLMVASRKANCGELVAKVVGLLPHTPVRAVGNNFHYACGKEDWGKSPLPMLGGNRSGALADLGRVEQTRWACVIRRDDVRIEVTVAEDEPGMAILFNFHRETKNAEEACKAAGYFEGDQRWSQELLRRLVGQEVAK
jgi:hypothetical protein